MGLLVRPLFVAVAAALLVYVIKNWRTLLPPLAVFAAFIGAWYFYSGVILDETRRKITLPYFHQVINESFVDPENRADLLGALWTSAWIAAIGLVISIILGLTFAVLMSQAKWIERSFYPYAVLIQTLPILALVPMIGLQFGFGIKARVIVVVIISLFPIITNTLFGLKSADEGHHDLFTLHGAGRLTRLFKLQFPSALPAMFTGFQISAGLAVIGEIVGGLFFGRGAVDLGNRIQLYVARLRAAELMGAIALSAALGVAVFWFFGYLRHRFTSAWADAE